MATTIQLTQSSSDLIGYLNGWTSGFGSTYGAFYDAQTSSLATTTIDPNTTYEAWGDGSTGGKGIVMSGALQYSQGNLTGSVDSIVLGTGYSQSTSGIAVSQQELLIDPDSAYSLAGARDLLDLAVYQLARFGSLAGFYDYFAATGTVIEDTAASNTLTGFAGADTFVFSGGNDVVAAGPTGTYGYQDGTDTLDVSAWGATSVDDLLWYNDSGNAVILSATDTSVSITLNGVDANVLDASDFIFANASALAVLALGLYGFQCLLDIIRARVLIRIGEDFDMRHSGRVHDAVVRLPLVNRMPGDGLQPLRDLDNVRGFLSGTGPTAFFDLPWMPLYLGICFLFHFWIGVTALAGAVLLVSLTILTNIFSQKPIRDTMVENMARNRQLEASRRNAEVVQAMGLGGRLGKRWQISNEAYLAANRKAGDVAGGLGNIAKSLRVVLQSAILAVGAWLVINQEASGGVMIASSIMMGRALAPVDLAISNWKSFVAARQSWARLRELFAQMPSNAAAMALPKPEKELRVENVTIVPPGERKPTVTGLGFIVTAGNALGVIGPSGSGKSTLSRILTGAWMPVAGKVRLDGASFEQWDREALGRHIGYLPQGVELFDGTIGENISRFEDNPDPEAIIAAARAAGAHELILRFEKGYDSDIGEAGSALSAGQRQRIGLARALYGDPFIVVLDEPNANLDAEGEAAVVKAISSVKARGGIAVVAHRPSAIGAVDFILMMEEGRMKAFGPRDEVLSKVLRVPQGQAVKGFAASAQTVSPLRVVADTQVQPVVLEDGREESNQEGDVDVKH